MGWNPTTQILTTPATDADMQAALSCYTTNAGDFFKADYIKKWAKHKPVRHPNVNSLEGNEWKGAQYEINAGYIYGIKCSVPQATLAALHDVTFEYHTPRGKGAGPNGADEWFRLMDFNKYYRTDYPSVSGIIPSMGMTTGESGGFAFGYTPSEYVVDYLEVMQAVTGDYGIQFSNCYLCLLISDRARTWNYAAALHSADERDNRAVVPVYSNGHWVTSWFADFGKPGDKTFTGFSKGDYLVTLFLYARSGSALGDSFLTDGTWNRVAAGDSQFLGRGVVIPECVAKTLTLQTREEASGYPTVSATRMLDTFSVGATYQKQWSGTRNITFSVTPYDSTGHTVLYGGGRSITLANQSYGLGRFYVDFQLYTQWPDMQFVVEPQEILFRFDVVDSSGMTAAGEQIEVIGMPVAPPIIRP